jgi:hypothetical protein
MARGEIGKPKSKEEMRNIWKTGLESDSSESEGNLERKEWRNILEVESKYLLKLKRK